MAISLTIEPGPSAPRVAREQARLVCAGVTSQRQADEVALVVSELVANAVTYGDGQISLVLRARRGEVYVAVMDRGSSFVVPPAIADGCRERGSGLGIVGAIASSWGVLSAGDAGKVVWCVLRARGRRATVDSAGPSVAFLLGTSEQMDEPGNREPALA